ncbi:hypothetical protein L218DRAFT_1008751 [Marasmius fiardii PR-910]|nr:hypothetical protein L218DRAFT_1008751 [Marasmius fiardii PR-910]
MIGDKAPVSTNNHGMGQECFMCGDNMHWTGDCPHQKKFIMLGWMKMGPDKRYILCDGSWLPSFAVAGGRKRKDIIEQWACERKWPGSETYHLDAYLYATEDDEDIENGVQEEGHIDEEAEMAVVQAWALFQDSMNQ